MDGEVGRIQEGRRPRRPRTRGSSGERERRLWRRSVHETGSGVEIEHYSLGPESRNQHQYSSLIDVRQTKDNHLGQQRQVNFTEFLFQILI